MKTLLLPWVFVGVIHAAALDPNTQKLLDVRASILKWAVTCDGQITAANGTCDPATGQANEDNGCEFGAELCYSSLISPKTASVGCSGVKAQQDPTGRVWRNPVDAQRRVPYVGSFSRDESTGVILYLGTTKDKEFALKWRNYIYGLKG
eukprot:519569_1